jgi:hypothetical protein
VLRLAFGALRGVVYPLARLFGRSNYMAVAAVRSTPEVSPGIPAASEQSDPLG